MAFKELSNLTHHPGFLGREPTDMLVYIVCTASEIKQHSLCISVRVSLIEQVIFSVVKAVL